MHMLCQPLGEAERQAPTPAMGGEGLWEGDHLHLMNIQKPSPWDEVF